MDDKPKKFLKYWHAAVWVCFLASFFHASSAYSQTKTDDFQKGQVIDTVQCIKNPVHHYALYLPADYNEFKKWPVIYIIEPGARARMPIDSMKFAAEKYGYILASSYNSHNGPWDQMFEANILMAEDIQARFSVDINRRYTCGFSGGSRGAIAMAVHFGDIQGVIGCGAGLPDYLPYQPTMESKFDYYGLVGNKDLNYLEMLDLDNYFSEIGLNSRIQTFNAGHRWPDTALLTEAIEWMELRAMNNGVLETDLLFINKLYKKDLMLLEQFKKQEKVLECSRLALDIIADYSGFYDVSAISEQLKNLEVSKSFKKAEKIWTQIRKEEDQRRELYLIKINQMLIYASLTDSSRRWWKNEFNELHQLEKNKNLDKSLMASRLISMLSVSFAEGGMEEMRLKQYVNSAFMFELFSMLLPENIYGYYHLAAALSLIGETKDALKALEKAIELGFGNFKLLDENPSFENLRNEQKFKDLLNKFK